jgi:hypothetical protein
VHGVLACVHEVATTTCPALPLHADAGDKERAPVLGLTGGDRRHQPPSPGHRQPPRPWLAKQAGTIHDDDITIIAASLLLPTPTHSRRFPNHHHVQFLPPLFKPLVSLSDDRFLPPPPPPVRIPSPFGKRALLPPSVAMAATIQVAGGP